MSKQRVYGKESGRGSLPIPASIPKRFHKYVMDYDKVDSAEGNGIFVVKGIAFDGANTPGAAHTICATVKEVVWELRGAEPCNCAHHCQGFDPDAEPNPTR